MNLGVGLMRVCSVDGCERSYSARGMCRLHYVRWTRTGDVVRSSQSFRGVCSVDGCVNPDRARGWCAKHYTRWRRYGDIRVTRRLAVGTHDQCTVGGCSRPHVAKGLCGAHYQHAKKFGDARWPNGDGARPCLVCTHPLKVEIEAMSDRFVPRHPVYGWAAIGRRFGIPSTSVARHAGSEHAMHLAKRSLERLQAARQLVGQ